MRETEPQGIRRTLLFYGAGLLAISLALGLLHVLYADVNAGRVDWFDLDKERNLATWFNGVVFFLFGCAAFVAYYWESRRNAEGQGRFRLPVLWLGVGLVGLYMSLDEITILHENLFWREVRVASDSRGEAWKYLTQWQILFAPAILLVVAYFVLFFSNRFAASRQARGLAFGGIGCWMGALLLEGLRGTLRVADGGGWYRWQVLLEEQLEMVGGILLLAAIVSYTLDVALDFSTERRKQLALASGFLTRRALIALAGSCAVLLLSAGAMYLMASRQAAAGDPVPGLFRRAVREAQAQRPEPARQPTDAPPVEVWFDDVAGAGPLPAVDPGQLAAFLAAGLGRAGAAGESVPALERDREPRLVLLSASDGTRQARSVIGQGRGLGAALQRAAAALREAGGDPGEAWVQLDIVERVDPEDRVDFTPPLKMVLGLHGLAFGRRSGIAFGPRQLAVLGMVSEELAVRPASMLQYLEQQDLAAAQRFRAMLQPRVPVPYRFFTTRGWFFGDDGPVALFRGHRVFDHVDPSLLRDAAVRAGQYLLRAALPDGRFVYSYRPGGGEADPGYNMLRHAGTIYALLELYESSGDRALLETAERAIAYLSLTTRPCAVEGREYACVVDGDSVKLGGNALALIALAKHRELTGDERHRQMMLDLAGWIQAVQSPEGEFRIHKQGYPGGEVSDFVSLYYPGEALLALARLYALEREAALLTAAENGARWLIEVRDAGLPTAELSHDHWLLYALNDIYRLSRRSLYLEHASRIATAIVDAQNRQPEYEDWLGSYYKPPRSTPTAIRTEGLAAAWALARDFGRPEEEARILEALKLGVRFELQTQIRPEQAAFGRDPQRALGGFTRGLTDDEIRIDYVQHNISALLAVARILESRN